MRKDSQDRTNWSEIQRFAQMFSALSNPVRLRLYLGVLHHIDSQLPPPRGPLRQIQRLVAKRFGIAESTLSHHLRILEQAGLIDRWREGRRVLANPSRTSLRELREFNTILSKQIQFLPPLEIDANPQMNRENQDS